MLTEWIVKERLSQIFNNNPQRSRLTGQPRKQKVELCTNRYAKLRIGKTGQKGELTGRSPLRRRRSASDCCAVEEKEKEKEKEKTSHTHTQYI